VRLPLDDETFDAITCGLYRAASGVQRWSTVLTAMSGAIDAWGIQLAGVDKRDGALLFSHEGGQYPLESALDYVRSYHLINPRVAPTLALQANEWFHDHEHLDSHYVEQSPFYQDFAIPYGARYSASTKVAESDERLVVMAALRDTTRGPFSTQERACLERFRRNLVRAFDLESDLGRKLEPIRIGAALLDAFERPMLLVDAERAIRFANRPGRALLDRANCVLDRAGMLRCADPAGDRQLTEALHALRLDDGGAVDLAGAPKRRFVKTLSRPDRQPVGLYLVVLRPQTTMGVFGRENIALVFFHDPSERSGIDAMMIAEAFDLTPAETRIAVALASGQSIAEIAAARGVSAHTVRVQLQSLFDKTGVRRQAELVRRITTMPTLFS
jgi:DNA-binding CsgD family transcriptional regulator